MLKIFYTETHGWEEAVRGMRNPYNAWSGSDSRYCLGDCDPNACYDCPQYEDGEGCVYPGEAPGEIAGRYLVGPKDFSLMRKLAEAGPDHGKYLRMITVSCDVLAPLYWWKQFDAYKIGVTANSCSTMHSIHAKEFTPEDFSGEHLWPAAEAMLKMVCEALNRYRDAYRKTGSKDAWWQMIQLLPSSYNQRRTVQLNYAVLRNIYKARENHLLDEWRDFCRWMEGLPCAELITGSGRKEAGND